MKKWNIAYYIIMSTLIGLCVIIAYVTVTHPDFEYPKLAEIETITVKGKIISVEYFWKKSGVGGYVYSTIVYFDALIKPIHLKGDYKFKIGATYKITFDIKTLEPTEIKLIEEL